MIAGKKRGVELIPLPGLYTLGAAEDFIAKAMISEPQANYVIQEVGTA
jgi:Fe2+ transport system protein B